MVASPEVRSVDPFDLPEWLGTAEVTWSATSSVRGEHRVTGQLSLRADGRTSPPRPVGCDLLAADQAFPVPVVAEEWRRRAHREWTYGQVLLVEYDGRLTLVVPGSAFAADQILESMTRLARAVGASPERYLVALRL